MAIRKALLTLSLFAAASTAAVSAGNAESPIFIRTEQYPRPPYSGATYYIYERDSATICTKLEVCNKYDECTSSYHRGRYKASEDQDTGEPYDASPATRIPAAKLKKHICLVRYKLIGT
jgi:hypothetical protein